MRVTDVLCEQRHRSHNVRPTLHRQPERSAPTASRRQKRQVAVCARIAVGSQTTFHFPLEKQQTTSKQSSAQRSAEPFRRLRATRLSSTQSLNRNHENHSSSSLSQNSLEDRRRHVSLRLAPNTESYLSLVDIVYNKSTTRRILAALRKPRVVKHKPSCPKTSELSCTYPAVRNFSHT
jgi:hypothetical protein